MEPAQLGHERLCWVFALLGLAVLKRVRPPGGGRQPGTRLRAIAAHFPPPKIERARPWRGAPLCLRSLRREECLMFKPCCGYML
jgi:hypothetical protein